MTYSNGDIIIALQEVLAKNLQFHNGTYSELPASIKLILDNLQSAFLEKRHEVFQQTLRALEIHLVNLTAQNEVYTHYYANHIPEKTFTLEDDFILENEAFRSHPVNNSNITNDLYLIAEAQIVEWYHTHHYFQAILSLYNCASASNAMSLPPFMVSEPLFSGR